MKERSLHQYLILVIIVLLAIISACEPDDTFSDDPRERIEGEWICTEESEIYDSPPYAVYISPDPIDSSKIIINNFYNLGTTVDAFARLSGRTITLDYQTISDPSTNWTILSGSGRVSASSDAINLSYSIDDGSGQIDNVTAVYERR